jgi:hypothetical protein
MTPLEAEADFESWWGREIKGDWTMTGVYELVKLAWMAGFAHHRELVRDAELRRGEERDDGNNQRVAEVNPQQQPGGLRGGAGSGGRA